MCFTSEEKSYCWKGTKDLCRGDCLQWNKCFARVSWGIYSATNRRSSPSAQNPIRFTSRSCLTWPTFHASSCRIKISLHLLVHKTQSPKDEYWQPLPPKIAVPTQRPSSILPKINLLNNLQFLHYFKQETRDKDLSNIFKHITLRRPLYMLVGTPKTSMEATLDTM